MSRVRLSRIFWIGAAATLVVSALVGIAGLVRSDFTETDGKVLLTLLCLLVAGGTAIAGLSLVDRERHTWFGWLTVVVAAAGFVLIEAATWDDIESDTLTKSAGTAAVALTGVLLASTQLLLHRGRLRAVVVATWIALFFAIWGTMVGIWAEVDDDGLWKVVGTCSILGVLGWLLVPVLQRFTPAGTEPSRIRILGELDGVELVASSGPIEGIEVEPPQAGERLVLRRQG